MGLAEPQSLCAVVVDDNRDAAETLAAVLTMMDCRAIFVTDPREAAEAVARSGAQFAFLDLSMPHLDGYALARLLRGHADAGELTIVGVSGYGLDPPRREKAFKAGFDELLVKPPDFERIGRILAARREGAGGDARLSR